MISGLLARNKRIPRLVEELQELWTDVDERLRIVTESDIELRNMAENVDFSQANDDCQSEFSAASQFSLVSAASARSGTSSVSVLSNLMNASVLSDASASNKSVFSIEGLDHSLLSRGKEDKYAQGGVGKSSRSGRKAYDEKRERKKERKRGRGLGRDPLGLITETDLCEELLGYANLSRVVRAVEELSDCLLLLGSPADVMTIISLQKTVDSSVEVLSSHTPNVAPAYPRAWLERKQMMPIFYFQEEVVTGVAKESTGYDASWWSRVADGIKLWRATRRISYNL